MSFKNFLTKLAKKSILTGAQMPVMHASDFVAGSRSNMLKEMREARGLYTALKLRKSLNNQDLVNTYKGMFKHVNPEHLDMSKVTNKQLEEMLAGKLNNGLRIKSRNTNDYLDGPQFTFKGNINKNPEKLFSHSKDVYAGARTNYAWSNMLSKVDANIEKRLKGTGAKVAPAGKDVNVQGLIDMRRAGDKKFNLGNEIENFMRARALPQATGTHLIPERLLPNEYTKSSDLPTMYQHAFANRGAKTTATREGLVGELDAWDAKHNANRKIYRDVNAESQAAKYKYKYVNRVNSSDPAHSKYDNLGNYVGSKQFNWPESDGNQLMRNMGLNNALYKQRWPEKDYTMARNLNYSEQMKGNVWKNYTPTPSDDYTGNLV